MQIPAKEPAISSQVPVRLHELRERGEISLEAFAQIAVDRPELVRRLILVGTGPRGGEDMDQLAPDVAPLFGKV
jgi:hypothetical protein